MSPNHGRRAARSRARRSRPQPVVALAVIALALAPVQTSSAASPSGLEGSAPRMSDEALADMRGKFVGPGGIAYFAVELRSSWTNAEGVTVAGVLSMSLDLRDLAGDSLGAAPLMLIGWSRDCADCPGGSGPRGVDRSLLTAGGLGTVHGVVQSQEIRGSDNVVRNGLRIDILPADQVQAGQPTGLTPANGSSSQWLPDGGAVHFVISGSRLGLALENGAGGLVGQSVDSTANQIAQNVLLTSNLNTVHNSIGLTIGVDQMRQAEQISMQNSMSVLKGYGY